MSSPGWEALQRAAAERRRQLLELAATQQRLEEEAKAAKLGVWQDGAKVDDPWVWRKRNPGGFR